MVDDATPVRLQVKCSEGLVDALGAYATAHHTSVSDVVRHAIANTIGYDLGVPVETRGRKAKYLTPEARKEAAKQRAQRERDIARELSRSFTAEDRQRVVAKIQKDLEAKSKR
jgi:hypothetical protein